MAKDTTGTEKRTVDEQEQLITEEVVLRDESDEIIDNLKNQLRSLQGQLDAYKTAEVGSGGGGGEPPEEELVHAWSTGLAPHLASKLQLPAEELTDRLERLIDQVDDRELRGELERCRDLAYFLFETFRRIGSSHRMLTESLMAPRATVETAEFCKVMENISPAAGASIPVNQESTIPSRIHFASRSAVTVMKALAELSTAIFGTALKLNVGHLAPGELGQGEPGYLTMQLYSETSWSDVPEGDDVSTFAMRQGITANTIVDILYVEKIVEIQGGDFAFHRSGGKVYGFTVRFPIERARD